MAIVAVLGCFGLGQAWAFEEPYCGLYSMHGALHALGIDANFDEMITAEYLSGNPGSTALDLVHLAEKHRATATYRTGMSLANLRAATSPIVLHTSAAVSETSFHHWVLFLGMEGSSVKLFDPPRTLYTVPVAELLSFWDGNGIVVQRRDNQQGLMQAMAMMPDLNLEFILAVLLVLVGGGVVLRSPAIGRHPMCGILLVAFISGVAWHVLVDYGFFWNQSALASVACSYDRDALPIVTIEQCRELIGRQDVTIVDARLSAAYERFHLPGAINIPVIAGRGAFREALAKIPVDNHVVVYCQSEGCTWADAIARQFPGRGYRRVSIFRGGMHAWDTFTADTP